MILWLWTVLVQQIGFWSDLDSAVRRDEVNVVQVSMLNEAM